MNKQQLIRRIWGFCIPFRKQFKYLLVLIAAQQILSAIYPILLGRLVGSISAHDSKVFYVTCIVWGILAIARPYVGRIRELYDISTFDYAFARHLSKISTKKYFEISIGQHSLGHSIIKRNVMKKGEAGIIGLTNLALYELIPVILAIGIPLILLLIYVPIVGGAVILFMIIFSIYTVRYNRRSMHGIRELDTYDNLMNKRQGELIDHAPVVQIFAQERRIRDEFDGDHAERSYRGLSVWIPYINCFYGGQYLITGSSVACVGLAGYFALNGSISIGTFVTAASWIAASLGTLTNISNLQRNLSKNMAPISKYFGFLDYKLDITVPDNPIHLPDLQGHITFCDVTYSYDARSKDDGINKDTEPEDEDDEGDEVTVKSERNAVCDISLEMEPGKMYAFVGRSGSGKSTLAGFIPRAYDPEKGQILIDGVDLRKLDFNEVRQHLGIVPQDVVLFDGTVRENVIFGLDGEDRNVSEEELQKVAKLSRISEFIGELEKGWDTLIGERGVKLSGGQRQRIGIARALVKDPPILIFDEATSSLDTENEAGIHESVMEASKGKTTIIIAHRLATVRDADKIFIFDSSRLVGEGTHDELLASNEYYQQLVQKQLNLGRQLVEAN